MYWNSRLRELKHMWSYATRKEEFRNGDTARRQRPVTRLAVYEDDEGRPLCHGDQMLVIVRPDRVND